MKSRQQEAASNARGPHPWPDAPHGASEEQGRPLRRLQGAV